MFLPDINLFVKLCGVTSLGEVLLPKEVRVKGGNGAHHRILREVCEGKPVSPERLASLLSAIGEHLLPEDKARRECMVKQSLEEIESSPPARENSRSAVSLEFWYRLYQLIPEERRPRTKKHLYSLLATSQTTLRQIETQGPGSLAERCNAPDHQTWRSWYAQMARQLNGRDSIPEVVSLALSVMGALGLILVWVAESVGELDADEKGQQVLIEKAIELLLAVDGEQTHPKKSVAKILEYAYQESEFKTKIEFLHKAFGSSESEVREAKRFMSGFAIPSYAQTIDAVSVCIDMNAEFERNWSAFVLVAQFIARSSKRIEVLTDTSRFDVCQLYQNYFEDMQAAFKVKSTPARTTY